MSHSLYYLNFSTCEITHGAIYYLAQNKSPACFLKLWLNYQTKHMKIGDRQKALQKCDQMPPSRALQLNSFRFYSRKSKMIHFDLFGENFFLKLQHFHMGISYTYQSQKVRKIGDQCKELQKSFHLPPSRAHLFKSFRIYNKISERFALKPEKQKQMKKL